MLIWETIRQQAEDSGEPVAFVSANPRDFAQGAKGTPLAESLADELREGASVTLWDTVTDFVAAHLRPALDVAKDLNRRLAEDATFADRLAADVERAATNRYSDPDLSLIDPRSLVNDWSTEYELDDAFLGEHFELTSDLSVTNALPLEPDQFLIIFSAQAYADVAFRLRAIRPDRLSAGDEERFLTGTTTCSLLLRLEATYRTDTRVAKDVRLTSASSLVDPEEERRQRFRAYLRSEPARRAWTRRAQAAATSWAKEQGYWDLRGESPQSLDIRSDDGAMFIEFVAEPSMVTWLQNAAQSLGFRRGLSGPETRAVIVVPSAPGPALAERVMNSLEPPIEMYVLVDDELLPVLGKGTKEDPRDA